MNHSQNHASGDPSATGEHESTPSYFDAITTKSIFLQAIELPESDRLRFVEEVCGENLDRKNEVLRLISANEQDGESILRFNFIDVLEKRLVTTETGSVDESGKKKLGGKYELGEELGRGGFGVVFRARQTYPVSRDVAIKILLPQRNNEEVLTRFHQEYRSVSCMDHPNIARVVDAGSIRGNRPFFVMELVEGLPINAYCDQHSLSVVDRLKLFRSVCNGIQHAHQKGIIHRDIKPSNVLVRETDAGPVAKIIDFGISRIVDDGSYAGVTQTGQLLGSLAYMSPEQASMGREDIDTRIDVYSLGVLLYELLTGSIPFYKSEGGNRGIPEMLRQIIDEEPQLPSSRIKSLTLPSTSTSSQSTSDADRQPSEPDVDELARQRDTNPKRLASALEGDLDWIVLKCLEKDRERRYGSPAELANDIQFHLEDLPVVAVAPSRRYRLYKFFKRNRRGVLAAAALTVSLVLGIIGTSLGLVWAIDARNESHRELSRANEIKRIISEMFYAVRPESTHGHDTQLMEQLLDETARRISEDNAEIGDQMVRGELHLLVGETYYRIGELHKARMHAEAFESMADLFSAESKRRELSAGNRLLARIYMDLEQYDRSLDYVHRSIDEAKAADSVAELVSSMDVLGEIRTNSESFDEAMEAFLTANEIEGLERPQRLIRICDVLRMQQSYDEAIAYADRAIDILSKGGAKQRFSLAKAKIALGAVYNARSRFDDAETVYLDAHETLTEILHRNHPARIESFYRIGVLYSRKQDARTAVPYLEEALSCKVETAGRDAEKTRFFALSLAFAYLYTGQEDSFVETVNGFSFSPDYLNILASVCYQMQWYEVAVEVLQKAVLAETKGENRLVQIGLYERKRALCCYENGDPEKGLSIVRQWKRDSENRRGKQDSESIDAAEISIGLLIAVGQNRHARLFADDCISNRQHEKFSIDGAQSLYVVGVNCFLDGDAEQALKYLQASFDRVLGLKMQDTKLLEEISLAICSCYRKLDNRQAGYEWFAERKRRFARQTGLENSDSKAITASMFEVLPIDRALTEGEQLLTQFRKSVGSQSRYYRMACASFARNLSTPTPGDDDASYVRAHAILDETNEKIVEHIETQQYLSPGALCNLASQYRDDGKYRKAHDLLDRLLRFCSPEDPNLHSYLKFAAQAKFTISKFDDAVVFQQRSIEALSASLKNSKSELSSQKLAEQKALLKFYRAFNFVVSRAKQAFEN